MTPREQVLASLNLLCRRAERSPHFGEWEPANPVRYYGPLTPSIAKDLDWSLGRTRRHLQAEADAGRVQRHMPHQSTARWWING